MALAWPFSQTESCHDAEADSYQRRPGHESETASAFLLLRRKSRAGSPIYSGVKITKDKEGANARQCCPAPHCSPRLKRCHTPVLVPTITKSIEGVRDGLCWSDCCGGPSLERCRPHVVVQAAAKNIEGPEDWWCRSDGGGGPSLERCRPPVVVLTSNKGVAFGAGSPYFEGVSKLTGCGVTIDVCNDIKKN